MIILIGQHIDYLIKVQHGSSQVNHKIVLIMGLASDLLPATNGGIIPKNITKRKKTTKRMFGARGTRSLYSTPLQLYCGMIPMQR